MVYETVDLYAAFSLPRGERTGGYLRVYAREEKKENREKRYPAVLVVPGGGYGMLSEREGEPVALSFFARGYVSFVLTYSVMTPYPAPLFEAGMAMAYIRRNAKKYFADPAHVCAIGFSAGGHLTGMLSTLFKDGCFDALKEAKSLVRPDAAILAYPVFTTGEFTHEGTAEIISGGDGALRRGLSLERCVTKESSPVFLFHTYEDGLVPVENALIAARSYREKGVPFELHLFERGEHGLSTLQRELFDGEPPYGVRRAAAWLELACGWLESRGFAVKEED